MTQPKAGTGRYLARTISWNACKLLLLSRQVNSCSDIAGDDADVKEEARTPGKDFVKVIGLDGVPGFEGSVLQQAQPLHCCIQAPADRSHQTGQLLCCPVSLHHNTKVLLKTRDLLL